MELAEYKEAMIVHLGKQTRNRKSKVEGEVLKIVEELIEANLPTTVQAIATRLGKKPQQIHQVLRKATLIRREKVGSTTLIVPTSMVEETTAPVEPETKPTKENIVTEKRSYEDEDEE